MGPPSRNKKIITILRKNKGTWITASQLFSQLSKEFRGRTGFASPRSLALYLRRFMFEKKKRKYFIATKKINEREEKNKLWGKQL